MKPEIRYATREMIEQASGAELRAAARALAVLEGERLLGVAGIYLERERSVMFANPIEPMRTYKRHVVKAYRTILGWARERGLPVLAMANPAVEGAAALLEHLGFRRLPGLDVYQWSDHGTR